LQLPYGLSSRAVKLIQAMQVFSHPETPRTQSGGTRPVILSECEISEGFLPAVEVTTRIFCTFARVSPIWLRLCGAGKFVVKIDRVQANQNNPCY
jgi:hypothetical protein